MGRTIEAGNALPAGRARAFVLLASLAVFVGCFRGSPVTEEYAETVRSPLAAGEGRIYVYIASNANNRYQVSVNDRDQVYVNNYTGVIGRREYTAFTLPPGGYMVTIGNLTREIHIQVGEEHVLYYPDERANMPVVGIFPAESMAGHFSNAKMVWNTSMPEGAKR